MLDLDAVTKDNWSALFYAAINSELAIIDFLVTEAKVKTSLVDRFKRSPVHWAARYDLVNVIAKLAELNCCALDTLDADGNTPTDIARLHRNMESFSLLKARVML